MTKLAQLWDIFHERRPSFCRCSLEGGREVISLPLKCWLHLRPSSDIPCLCLVSWLDSPIHLTIHRYCTLEVTSVYLIKKGTLYEIC